MVGVVVFSVLMYMGLLLGTIAYTLICEYKILEKAGEKGWKAFIPVYGGIVEYKVIGLAPGLIAIPLVGAFLVEIASLSEATGKTGMLFYVLGYIAIMTMSIISNIWLGKAFKKSSGFICGLVFLSPIFLGILAFGSSKYKSEKNKEDVIEAEIINEEPIIEKIEE